MMLHHVFRRIACAALSAALLAGSPAVSAVTLYAAGTESVSAAEAAVGESAHKIAYRFASKEEGQQLLLSNDQYIGNFTQGDLDFRLQKKGGTVEEWKTIAEKAVMDWTKEEEAALSAGMETLFLNCEENGYVLPASEEIVFVKTDMTEEGGAEGYTHGTQIYLNRDVPLQLIPDDENPDKYLQGLTVLAHELFHCLTRSNPDFRADMYEIIHFTVHDEEYEFAPEVRERMINNPDVEHHNSSAVFRINGEDVPCTVVFYASRPFEEEGDSFFDLGRSGLVPADSPDKIYDSEEAENFFDVFGKNTDYVIDPEETMADNFSYVLVYGADGMEYKTPEIPEAIISYLKGETP